MSECTHDCSACKEKCSSRDPKSLLEPCNPASQVKHVIGIVSGKGGVGKSLITSLLAVEMQRRGFQSAILDADITGPSIPKAFGLACGEVEGSDLGMFPKQTKTGIEVMSLNLLVDQQDKPVVWRGPVIAGTVKQFWTDVVWGDVDYMFIDMPPGTGDVPLTVFQSLPIDGIIVVTSPQELVSMIVAKAVNMANLMNIPVLGLVENYSYFECKECGKKHSIFGESHLEEYAAQTGLKVLGKLPIDPALAALSDKGIIELHENNYISATADAIEQALND